MIDKMSKDDCVGCGLCASVCDRQAITMQPDECTGFFYPFIDASKCTECKKCQISCPVVVKRKSCKLKTQRTNSPKCFAVRSLNDETRFASTSGGFFTEIATEILDNGGKVYGVGYSDGMDVLHMRIDNTADLKVLQKSKYVQSDMRDVYVDIKKDIESGDLVLFVGCPCQVAAIYSFLGKNYANLYTIEFICMGVNSPLA